MTLTPDERHAVADELRWLAHRREQNAVMSPEWLRQRADWIEVSGERRAPARERPMIVCLCGSTRFYDEFQQANYDLTMSGEIVLSVGFYPHAKAEHGHGEGVGHDSVEKVALDELHKRKIDLADYVLVLNVDGYIGESTRSEIKHAEQLGKPIRYLECPDGALTVAAESRGDDALDSVLRWGEP